MGALSGDGDVDIRSGAALVVGHKNQSTTFSGTIHGAGQLIKTGSSMLTFTGTNSCSNGTFIHQGTLAINRNDQLGSPTSILAFEDATLQANAALSIPHRLVIYSKATVNTQGYACDLPGLISSTGKLIKTGTGTLTLGGANSYGGGTTISQGTLVGSVSSFPGSITNDGQLVFIQAFGATFAGAISGAGSVVKRGAGKLTLSGDNTFTGTMTVEEGTLAISRDTSLGGAGKPVTLAGGTMLETTDDLTTGRAIALNAGLCTINVPTKMQGRLPVTATLSGAITGAGDLVKTGGGVLALSGTNSYLGSTWIKGGTLGASATTQLGAVSSGWLQFDGGTLRFTANGWIHKPTGLFAAGGTVDTNGHQALLSDQITGEGGLTKTGSGTLELSHASNNYEGPTRVLGGALGVSSNNNLGHPTSGIVLDGGTLKALASFPTPRAITLSGDSGAIDTNGKSVECAGPITGPGALNKAGPGALTLTGAANTYAGETRILQGTLAVASQLNLGPGSVLLSGSDAALNVSTSMIVGSGGPPALTVPNTVTTGGATVTSILKIATGGTLTVAGGTLSASEVDHTWGGTLLFSGGTLKVNTFRGSLTNQGGTLLANGFSGTTQVLGSYHQTAGTLEVRISGIAANQFGKLNVTGSAQLGGGLKVSLGGGFTPTAGQRFPILTSGNQSGTFANAATYVDVVGGGRFQVSYTGTDVVLTNYVPFTVIDLAEGQSFAVNCGGGPVAATSMGDFAGDQQYGGASNNAWGYTAGGAYWYGGGIFGAPGPLEEVFRDLRSVSSDFEYRFAMKHNGTYQLDLLFAEIAAGNRNALRQGLRIFHVEMEGQRVLRNWSPVEAAGGGQVITQGDGAAYTAAVRTFTVDVLDNELNVLFRYLGATSPPSTPIINGIKITRLATRPPGPPSGDLEDMTVTDEAVANILGIDDIDGPGPFENHIDLGPPAIRSASLAADASSAAGAYTIRSAGGDIWDNWDRGHFLYRKVPGNYVLESDLEWASPGPNVSAKMGLMARTNLTGNAAAVFVETIGGGTNPNPEATAFQARTSDGAGTSLVAETPAGPAGSGYRARRLRLERSGRNFKAWWDNGDGHGLRVLGSVSLPPDTPEEMYWGLALTSHDESFCSEGRFTNLREYLPRDSDWDGVADYADNCPYHDNRDQDNADQDSAGDACDGCPGDDEKVEPGLCGCWDPDDDSDGDGTLDCQDECWGDPNKVNPGVCGCGHPDVDSDSDGRLDCEDDCPADSNKTLPGVCGCGYSDTDTDGDGVADCADGCPNDPTRTAPGLCGCGQAEFDADADGVVDCLDNCPGLANPGQADLDGDHAGDACDLDDDSLLVSEPDMVLVPEGGTADLSVKLRFSPPFPPPITWLAAANWLSGDQSIVVVPRPPLVFDYTNWNVYQTVTLSALPDSDIENGQAYIQCLIPYVGSKIIRVVEQDRDRPGDFDGDNDVDQDDFELFETCASGPAVGLAPGCEGKDLDRDGDIDQDDFGRFQRCYSGAGKPSNPNCAN